MAIITILSTSASMENKRVSFIFQSNGRIYFTPDSNTASYLDITNVIGTSEFQFGNNSMVNAVMFDFSNKIIEFFDAMSNRSVQEECPLRQQTLNLSERLQEIRNRNQSPSAHFIL